jgi:hypothetical protein
MRPGPSCHDELVSNATRERQVGDGCVQVTELPATEPEFNPAEAMIVRCHPFPARNGGANCFNGRTRRPDLAGVLGGRTVNRNRVRVSWHGFILSVHSGRQVSTFKCS